MADIITYPENGITYDADDASGFLATRLSGVYSAEEDFSVTAQGGLSVQVSAGQAWVRPARFKGRSIIMAQPGTLTLTAADAVRSRIDRIVLRYDAAAKKTSLQVLDGTPDSAAPAAPEISRTELVYDLCLAEIKRPAGSAAVTAADITDTRADETVCGVMRDGVTGIPAATLIQRLRAEIDKLDNGSFYDKTEVDTLLNALQEQVSKVGTVTARPVFHALTALTIEIPDNVDYLIFTGSTNRTNDTDTTINVANMVARGGSITFSDSDNPTTYVFHQSGTLEATYHPGSAIQKTNIIGYHYEISNAVPLLIGQFAATANQYNSRTYTIPEGTDYITFADCSPYDVSAIPILRGWSHAYCAGLNFAEDGTLTFKASSAAATLKIACYHYFTPEELNSKLTAAESAQADADALNLDQDYRLTLLELGVTDDETTETTA